MRVIGDLNQKAMKLNVIICGSADASEYNPVIAFQMPIRKGILIGLHAGYSVGDVAKSLNVSK